MKNFVVSFYLLPILCVSLVMQSCNAQKQHIVKKVAEIKNKELAIATGEGSLEEGGFIFNHYHVNDELFIYTYYDNANGLLNEEYVFDNTRLIFFEAKKTKEDDGKLDYYYSAYFKNDSLILDKSRGNLPEEYSNKVTAESNILKYSEKVMEVWYKVRGIE